MNSALHWLWSNGGVGNFTATLILAGPVALRALKRLRRLEAELVAQAERHKAALAGIGKLREDFLQHNFRLRDELHTFTGVVKDLVTPNPAAAPDETVETPPASMSEPVTPATEPPTP